MRGFRPSMFLLLALMLAWPLLAQAAARVVSPRNWVEASEAAPEAQRRAGRWKDTLGLRLVQVLSGSEEDGFAETAAMFERNEVVSIDVMQSEASAVGELGRVVANVVGSEPPEASGLRTTVTGESVAWGRWIVDDLAYECVLAPSGDNSSVLVIAVPAGEVSGHRDAIDGMIANLEGVSEPMPRFSLLAWRIGAVLLWLALGVALHAVMLRSVDQDDDHATAGKRAAVINLGFVAIGSVAAYLALVPRQLAIVHSGSSVTSMTVWISVTGIVVVGAHFFLTSRMDRGVVQSAPSSGAFASGTYSRTDMMRLMARAGGPPPSEGSGTWTRTAGQGLPSTSVDPGTGPIEVDREELE